MSLTDVPASFWKHVDDLRNTVICVLGTIIVGICCSLFFYKEILAFLITPSIQFQNGLVVLGPIDGFLTCLKTCFWVGLVSTSPIWIFFIMNFIAPALDTHQRRWVTPFVAFSLVFLFLGLSFSYYVTIPISNEFLSSFNSEIGINMWTLSSYLDYTLILMLSSALAFELNVILLFLVHYGIISAERLIGLRRYAIVVIFILAAIFTPPDVFTQLMLAIPLMIMYELAILYAKFRLVRDKRVISDARDTRD